MLIIEGPDRVGKSTFVKELIRRLGELNGGKEPGTDHFGLEDSALDTVDGYAPRIKPWTVSDRGWLSEVVYGEELRGHSNVTPNMRYILDGMQAAAGGFTVLVHARKNLYAHLLDLHWSDEEAFGKKDLAKAAARFQKIAEAPRFGVPANIMTVAVTQAVPGSAMSRILYPTALRPPSDADPVSVIAGLYLQLYCELGAPEAK